MLMPRRVEEKQSDSIGQVLKKIRTGKENGQRIRRAIDQDINILLTQAGTREGAPLLLAVEEETARMIQVMKLLMILKGSGIQGDVTYHHHPSGQGEDKFRGLHIASILSAGILLILLLRRAGEEGQDPDHLCGGRDDWRKDPTAIESQNYVQY